MVFKIMMEYQGENSNKFFKSWKVGRKKTGSFKKENGRCLIQTFAFKFEQKS